MSWGLLACWIKLKKNANNFFEGQKRATSKRNGQNLDVFQIGCRLDGWAILLIDSPLGIPCIRPPPRCGLITPLSVDSKIENHESSMPSALSTWYKRCLQANVLAFMPLKQLPRWENNLMAGTDNQDKLRSVFMPLLFGMHCDFLFVFLF